MIKKKEEEKKPSNTIQFTAAFQVSDCLRNPASSPLSSPLLFPFPYPNCTAYSNLAWSFLKVPNVKVINGNTAIGNGCFRK